jgi:dethiobiotin synthetase
MSLFVTGTDTGVGKTVVSALLLARFGRDRPLAYWKPVATGADCERDRTTVEAMVSGATTAAEAYLYADPVSPHLAARREGLPIEIERVVSRFQELRVAMGERSWIVEGAGGLLVPLDKRGRTMVDLIRALGLPALLVARSTLGTINHTLLSLEALRSRRVPVAGVAMVGPPNADNREAVERFGNVTVLLELPRLEPFDLAAAEADPATTVDDVALGDLLTLPEA